MYRVSAQCSVRKCAHTFEKLMDLIPFQVTPRLRSGTGTHPSRPLRLRSGTWRSPGNITRSPSVVEGGREGLLQRQLRLRVFLGFGIILSGIGGNQLALVKIDACRLGQLKLKTSQSVRSVNAYPIGPSYFCFLALGGNMQYGQIAVSRHIARPVESYL